eukprot:102250-Rhodomonas_salina.1
MPYELIQSTPPPVQDLLAEGIDEFLAGAELPGGWKGSRANYLFKREPADFLENLRPVKLLTKQYKTISSLIYSHLKAELEHLGLLEPSQGAF